MKTHYFTPENIDAKSLAMLEEAAPLMRKVEKFIPSRSALLILDMQRYFLEANSHAYIPSAKTIFPRLNALQEAYATSGLPIVWTRHLNTPADAGSMSRRWRDLIERENPLSEIHPALDSSSGIIIEKTQYDAFYETNLEAYLRERDVEQILISGVMTHLCCETTTRSAFVHGFDVFFLIDGTATYNEDFHRATLRNLAHGFATLVLCEDILAAFRF